MCQNSAYSIDVLPFIMHALTKESVKIELTSKEYVLTDFCMQMHNPNIDVKKLQTIPTFLEGLIRIHSL